VQSVALIEPGFAGDAFEEKGIEQEVVADGEFGIDRVEVAPVLAAEIGRRPHAGEQHDHAPFRQTTHDRVERLAGDLGIDPAQHVVGAKFDDDRIRPLRDRPIEAGKPAGGSIARDSRIGDLDGEALDLERPLKLHRKGSVDRQPKAGGERIAQGHDPHRPIGGGWRAHGKRERQRDHNRRKCLDPRPVTPI
jgi:hypothetical protein